MKSIGTVIAAITLVVAGAALLLDAGFVVRQSGGKGASPTHAERLIRPASVSASSGRGVQLGIGAVLLLAGGFVWANRPARSRDS